MVPQKLCGDCWNQRAERKNGDDQKRAAAASAGTDQSASIKQPETLGVTAGKLSTAKADLRAGVSASEALPMRHTHEAAITGQIVKDDSAAAKNSNSSAPPNHDASTVKSVTIGKSTIEVRRRSRYVEDRARATPPPSQDRDRALTTDPSSSGSTVDQSVQSTTVQTLSASAGSKPRQTSANNVQQHSPVDGTSPDAQPSSVPEVIPEERPAGSGPIAGTGGNTNQQGNTTELGQQDIVQDNMGCRCSAPTIDEIHPLPCSNPPYNPDFDEARSAARSATQRYRGATDTPPAGRLDLNPSEAQNREQHQRKQQPRDVSATTGRQGLTMSFLLSNSRQQYPAEQPPKYEDIINENDVATATAPEAPASQTQLSQAVLPSPTEPVAATTTPLTMRLVRSFGKYGEISTQPGVFRAPRRVSVSPVATTEATSTRVVVSDSVNGTVQVFGDAGDCLSMLRANAVKGCCLLDDNHSLLIATDRAVEVSCTLTTCVARRALREVFVVDKRYNVIR